MPASGHDIVLLHGIFKSHEHLLNSTFMSQAVFCASGSRNATGLDGLSPARAAGLPLTQRAMKRDAVTTALCQPTDGHQIWQVCRLPWQGPC